MSRGVEEVVGGTVPSVRASAPPPHPPTSAIRVAQGPLLLLTSIITVAEGTAGALRMCLLLRPEPERGRGVTRGMGGVAIQGGEEEERCTHQRTNAHAHHGLGRANKV